MSLQVLVAALEQNVSRLLEQMKIDSDAVIINQCDTDAIKRYRWNNHQIVEMSMADRGVGKSRNTAILLSTADILLFSDQDIVYKNGYTTAILREFQKHPEADMILFNVRVDPSRKTYENKKWKRVHWYNAGRYGAVSFAIKREKLAESRVMFSLLFGGGARYSAGEDSLFLKDFMDRNYRVYASPVTIGTEENSESTWFKGYDQKFFFDRGVLYKQLYGIWADLLAWRFLFAHKHILCTKLTLREAHLEMTKGIKQGENT